MRINAWDRSLATKDTNLVLLGLAQWHLQQCSTNLIETGQLIKRADFLGLGRMSVPTWLNANDFYHHRQVKAFFQKRKDLSDPAVDKKAAAWKSFIEAEELCRQTNSIFRSRAEGRFYFAPRVESVLYASQRKIARILGDLPSLETLFLRFGPGATTLTKKKNASARRKLSSAFACSEDSLGLIAEVLEEMPAWTTDDGSEELTVCDVLVTDDVIEFAPKTFEIDRTIAKTSVVTGMVQLGVGDYMADRLRTEGVDIRDQSRNQRLARVGSIDGSLGTADLTNASNCVSRLLVMDQFPYEWYDFLVRLTSTNVITPSGDRLATEMFSTMGNGFTFPVETLIFYAFAKSVCEELGLTGEVAVYGDDIVLPTEGYELLAQVLTATGFMLNKAKSFFDGPFRESCGRDWYLGLDVRPCFIKGPLSGASLFVLHNYYRRRGLTEPAARLVDLLDDSLRVYGPEGFGDGHLLGEYHLEPYRRDRGWSGYTFETFTFLPKRVYYSLGADYVFPSYSIYVKDRSLNDDEKSSFGSLTAAVEKVREHLSPQLRRDLKLHGDLRPERSDARYKKVKGRWRLEDTLPGVEGYKRIRIYTTKTPLSLTSLAAPMLQDRLVDEIGAAGATWLPSA